MNELEGVGITAAVHALMAREGCLSDGDPAGPECSVHREPYIGIRCSWAETHALIVLEAFADAVFRQAFDS